MQNCSLDLSPLVAVLVRPHRMPIHVDNSMHISKLVSLLGFDFHSLLRYMFEVKQSSAKYEVMPLHRRSDPTLPESVVDLYSIEESVQTVSMWDSVGPQLCFHADLWQCVFVFPHNFEENIQMRQNMYTVAAARPVCTYSCGVFRDYFGCKIALLIYPLWLQF